MLSSVTCTSPPQDECEAQRDGDQEMDGGSEVEDDVKKMIYHRKYDLLSSLTEGSRNFIASCDFAASLHPNEMSHMLN